MTPPTTFPHDEQCTASTTKLDTYADGTYRTFECIDCGATVVIDAFGVRQ